MAAPASRARLRAVVDRVEDGRAAVLVPSGGGQMILPVSAFSLPPREGAVFDVIFREKPEAERAGRSRTAALQQSLLQKTRRRK